MSLYAWAGYKDPNSRIMLTMPSDAIFCSNTRRPNRDLVNKLAVAQNREMNPKKRLKILKQLYQATRVEVGAPALFGLNMIYAMTDRIDYDWVPGTSGFPALRESGL